MRLFWKMYAPDTSEADYPLIQEYVRTCFVFDRIRCN